MRHIISILRRESPEGDPYIQDFEYEAISDRDTVATALTELNNRPDLCDVSGNPAGRIEWECSCLQKKCGACAMLINGRPMLACDALISDIASWVIRLEPLRKFPVISDLRVDRSVLFENLKTLKLWLGAPSDLADEDRDMAYEGSECVQCGCCLEICPNFYVGGDFFGMSAVPITTRLLNEMDPATYRGIAREYSRHVFEGCGKSLSCKEICPRGIDTEKLLVNSNALAIWKRKRKKKTERKK